MIAAPPPRSASLLSLRDVDCVRGGRLLFKGLNATLEGGQVLRVLGENGAGKTSLLRIVCGLLSPAKGEVLWRGAPVSGQRDAFHRELVYIGHAAALKDDLTPLENLRMSATLGGMTIPGDAARAALADAGLKGRLHAPARALSQGQRRRVALARLVLVADDPASAGGLWVLDEPFNALDAAAVRWLSSLIDRHAVRGGAVMLTSHQPVALNPAVPQPSLSL